MKIANLFFGAAIAAAAGLSGAQAQDWSGAYAGVFGGSSYNVSTSATAAFQGVRLGYNWQNESIVYGGELEVGSFPSAAVTYVQVSGRVGYVAPGDIFVFGILGYNGSSAPSNSFRYGMGAEIMIGENLSLRVDGVQSWRVGTGVTTNTLTLGLNWNF